MPVAGAANGQAARQLAAEGLALGHGTAGTVLHALGEQHDEDVGEPARFCTTAANSRMRRPFTHNTSRVRETMATVSAGIHVLCAHGLAALSSSFESRPKLKSPTAARAMNAQQDGTIAREAQVTKMWLDLLPASSTKTTASGFGTASSAHVPGRNPDVAHHPGLARAQLSDLHVRQLLAELLGEERGAGEHGEILHHGLAVVAEARLDLDLRGAADLDDDDAAGQLRHHSLSLSFSYCEAAPSMASRIVSHHHSMEAFSPAPSSRIVSSFAMVPGLHTPS